MAVHCIYNNSIPRILKATEFCLVVNDDNRSEFPRHLVYFPVRYLGSLSSYASYGWHTPFWWEMVTWPTCLKRTVIWNRRSWFGTCWSEASYQPEDVAVSAQSTVSNLNTLVHIVMLTVCEHYTDGDFISWWRTSISSSSVVHRRKWSTAFPAATSSVQIRWKNHDRKTFTHQDE